MFPSDGDFTNYDDFDINNGEDGHDSEAGDAAVTAVTEVRMATVSVTDARPRIAVLINAIFHFSFPK